MCLGGLVRSQQSTPPSTDEIIRRSWRQSVSGILMNKLGLLAEKETHGVLEEAAFLTAESMGRRWRVAEAADSSGCGSGKMMEESGKEYNMCDIKKKS